MPAQRHVRGALVLIASLLAAPLHASCGCEAADDRPCVQEAFATVSITVPATVQVEPAGMELSLLECWGCGGPNDFVPAFLIALLLLPPLIVLKRLERPGQLIVLRLDLMSRSSTPAAAPAVLSRRPLVNASRLHGVFA